MEIKMAISARSLLIFLFTVLLPFLLTISNAAAESNSDLVNELVSLQSGSESGVIRINDHFVSRFLSSTKTPRPYSLLIFFDAIQLHDNSDLHLLDLRREFGILATSFIANNKDQQPSKLFFCEIEFKESQSSFGLFGVNALPHVRLVGPDAANLKTDSIAMNQGDFSRMVDSMAEFVQSRTKLTVGPIQRPPMFSKKQIGFMVALVLISAPFIIKKVLSGETLVHDSRVWLSGAVFIYFFSVSGAMHNIIRKMPMFMQDRNDPNKFIYFYQGSGMQLGAEGFAVGSLYTVVGLLLSFVTTVLVRVRSELTQRIVMLLALLISFWAVGKVISLDNWKTGYGIHGYWPSSW